MEGWYRGRADGVHEASAMVSAAAATCTGDCGVVCGILTSGPFPTGGQLVNQITTISSVPLVS
jgi:hypothetical protein